MSRSEDGRRTSRGWQQAVTYFLSSKERQRAITNVQKSQRCKGKEARQGNYKQFKGADRRHRSL